MGQFIISIVKNVKTVPNQNHIQMEKDASIVKKTNLLIKCKNVKSVHYYRHIIKLPKNVNAQIKVIIGFQISVLNVSNIKYLMKN